MSAGNIPRRALVTGGSSGIGKAIAEKFSAEGIEVRIADKTEYHGNAENISFKSCDVTRAGDINALFAWSHEKKDPDILVINAGQGIQEKLTEGDPEKWQKVVDTNLMGALRCIRAFVPAMLEKKKGHVVIISSVAANQPHPYGGIYSATKTALEVVAETLRLETLPHISVTVVSPGITDTSFFKNQISGNSSVKELDMGAISPEEIAKDVFYAISKKGGSSINKIITRPINQSF
ncbi:MAG: SDR family oxidoreductase [Salegentibacter sp.]